MLSKMTKYRFGLFLSSIAALAMLTGARAVAGAFNYGSQATTINVAYVLVHSDRQEVYGAPDPFVFYILNNRTDLRPANWTFANPLGPKVVSTEIYNRYQSLTIGAPITSNMAPYWQVDLDSLTTSNVTQFNFLIIHMDKNAYTSSAPLNLSAWERRVLRQFLDMGGTLLIDGGSSMRSYPGLFTDVQWFNQGKTGFAETNVNGQRHPLLSVPYFLSQQEINQLGANNIGNYFMTAGRSSTILASPMNPPDSTIFQTVVGNSAELGMPYIAAGDYGSGHIIVTAANICSDISNPVASASGSPPVPPVYCSATDFSSAHPEDLKFLVNAISYASDCSETDQFNPRHTSTAFSEFGGALLPMWEYPPSTPIDFTGTWLNNNWASSTTPAIFGNIAYVTDGQGYLHAFDVNPPEDLDGNGIPDDTADTPTADPLVTNGSAHEMSNLDLSQGRVYDQLWSYQVSNGPLSAPTVGTLPLPSNPFNGFSYVIVEAQDGSIWECPACVSGGGVTKIYPLSGVSATSFTGTPPAPTIYRGRIFAIQPGGSLAVIDQWHPYGGITGSDPIKQNSFTVPLPVNVTTSVSGVTPVYNPPAVASIPSNDATFGGCDLVVTVSSNFGVGSFLVGSLDEALQCTDTPVPTVLPAHFESKSMAVGSALNVTDAPEDRSSDLGFNQWAYVSDSNYGLYSNFTAIFEGPSQGTAADPSGPFEIQPTSTFPTSTASTPALPLVYADYDLSSNSAVPVGAPARVQINPNVLTLSGWTLSGSPIVTQTNQTVYTANGPGTSYIAGVQDQNALLTQPPALSSGSIMKWRFALVGGSSTGVTASPVVDGDGIQYSFAGYRFIGSPVAGTDGFVYALAANATNVIVMCINPNAPIWGNVPVSGFRNTQVVLTQFDDTRYINTTTFPKGTGDETVDPRGNEIPQGYNGGWFRIADFSDNFVTTPPALQPNIGFPMPVQAVVTTQGATGATNNAVPQIVPLHSSSTGVPMLYWWANVTTAKGVSASGVLAPMAMIGEWLYFGGQDSAGHNYIYSVNAETISLGVGVNGATREINETSNAAYFNKFTSQVGTINSLLASAGRYAVAQGTLGIEGFGNMLTLVSDNNRLVAFNPDGSAEWSCDSTYQQQQQGGPNAQVQTTSKTPINRPSTLAQLSASDYLVADSGNDRCVRLDQSGQATWELTSFNDPNGIMRAGQPNTLKQPTSCVTWATYYPANSSSPTMMTNHYLIADSGNYRVLEVDDIYTIAPSSGSSQGYSIDPTNPNVYHTLVWESHTAEQGRMYRYVAAQVYQAADGNSYIMAAISNKRVAPVIAMTSGATTTFGLQSPSSDTTGSSIVLLYYGINYGDAVTVGSVPVDYSVRPAAGSNAAVYFGGTIAFRYIYNGAQAMLPLITYVLCPQDSNIKAPPGTPLRGVRFLVDYYRYPASFTTQRTLVCDIDGVFDALPYYAQVGSTTASGMTQYVWYLDAAPWRASYNGTDLNPSDQYVFAFTQNEYNASVAQYSVTLNSLTSMPYRNSIFDPSSALFLPNQDYLITNRASSGDPGSADIATIGGNVFEYDPSPTASTALVDVWGLPSNAGPIVQPAFSMRPL